jgi:hypothetical protein
MWIMRGENRGDGCADVVLVEVYFLRRRVQGKAKGIEGG